MSKGGKLIIFSAPSGSGKTTIVRHLLKQPELNLAFSVSATSRPPSQVVSAAVLRQQTGRPRANVLFLADLPQNIP